MNKKKIAVLGAGSIGSVVAAELSRDYDVLSIDIDQDNLRNLKNNFPVETAIANIVLWHEVEKHIRPVDLVISAVPGYVGFQTLKNILNSGKNAVDISFSNEDPFELEKMAFEKGLTVVVDCGVSPGMSSIILGHFNSKMKINEFRCFVGGLPFEVSAPFKYKAPFSPVDVIEEYTRPARIVENSRITSRPALSGCEVIDIQPVGKLEAFYTDGLRTLLATMKIPNMSEKTLRYPGHAAQMSFLKNAGFFDDKKIDVRGTKISPIDFTTTLLFPNWHLKEGEKEFTLFRLIIKGEENGKEKEYICDMYDEYDEQTKRTSMARTTGYTCVAAAKLILEEEFTRKGISPPEYVGAEEKCFDKVFSFLKKKGISYSCIENEAKKE